MRNLSASDVVSAWERTQDQPPALKALALLSLAAPECPADELAGLSIGQRDARLLELRERLFGPRLNAVTVCPRCQGRIELGFGVADIRVEPPAPSPGSESARAMSFTQDGYRVRFRLPNSLDLASLEPASDADDARQRLLGRCIESIVREVGDDAEIDPAEVPAGIAAAIAGQMAEADPQADTRLALGCPDCHYQWQAAFDIATYLVAEIDELVGHLLRQVHGLARAYGWREADILAMTPARRRAYLDLVAAG
jgi:hypothetical protein